MVTTLAQFIDFLIDFIIATLLIGLYLLIYTFATAHNEFTLIRRNVISAALSLGLSLVGFAVPLSSAIVNTNTLVDLVFWGIIAIVVQILAYGFARIVIPDLTRRIADGEIGAATFLGAVSLAAGIANSACMTI
ncbi:DUF350 domain-containing protein [Pseudochelatococcus contaminans]|uniref:Putative membrane protein n=1 Tax=Pseudochelatococcus contaminans TaxID=1538103 RepID=A0A7W5Z1K9_9HYPH|nr:DUF350 domain-containing protein [Pseudochelatococcus contaminans]MBB3808405.1 putative membrane protein [Pseudochelatococcus contaminans]